MTAFNHVTIQAMTPEQSLRYWSKVNKASEDECWEWSGARNGKGYGQFGLNGKSTSTHRISYTIHHGEIPDGMIICHLCNNPPCVNPRHLYLGTAHDNMRQAVNEGRLAPQRKTHCKNGHEFTPENTIIRNQGNKKGRTSGSTYRCCKECKRIHDSKRINTPERQKYHAEYYQKYRGISKGIRGGEDTLADEPPTLF